MRINDFRVACGFLKITLEINDDSLFVKERSPVFSRERDIRFSELSPNYLIVKRGFPGMLITSVYILVLGILLDIFQKRLFDSTIPFREIGAVIVLLSLFVEHLRIFRVAQFPFKTGNQVVQIMLKHERFIEELSSRIRKSRSGYTESGGGSEESND